jgi:hypothetical protein
MKAAEHSAAFTSPILGFKQADTAVAQLVLQVTPLSVKEVGGEFVPVHVPLKPGALLSVVPGGIVPL